jgi:hypothetical protein
MEKLSPSFELELNGVKMAVTEIPIQDFTCFRIVFSSPRKPIVIVRAKDVNSNWFWATIPEDITRQKEAEGVGKLIEDYFKKKKK